MQLAAAAAFVGAVGTKAVQAQPAIGAVKAFDQFNRAGKVKAAAG